MRRLETPSPEIAQGGDIATIVALRAEARSLQPAVIHGERMVRWGEHAARVQQVANALIGLGIRKGDRVATLALNCIEYQEAFLGTLVAGGCAVPLPTMASPEALNLMLEDGADVDAETLRSWANQRLGKGQRIAEVEIREELPKSDTGKVLKRELRAPYWDQ
jgi:acyl-CoA synthetase (AMP-forming)/AMP-acid ligase II